MEDKIKKLITATVILGFIVLGLGGYIIYDKFVVKPMPKTEEKKDEKEEAKEYKKGDIITFSDGSKWYALEDSDKTNDVVKLMNIKDFGLYGQNCAEQSEYIYCASSDELRAKLGDEYFNYYTEYSGSQIEQLINSFADQLPVNVKEVNGYKIRLLSIADIMAYDDNWNKVSDNEYVYAEASKGLPDEFWGAWLMDVVVNKCYGQFQEDGRCAGNTSVFFTVGLKEDHTTSLAPGASGLAEIKPVIYAYKDSIK